ncbi:MAG: ArsR/SmtB family transcription factor [Pseudomonadales bacterium]
MKDYTELEHSAEKAVILLKALANKHRLLMMCALQDGELSVSQLNELFPIPQSSLSQHLAWLRRESFVKTRRNAQTIYYSLNSEEIVSVINTLQHIYREEQAVAS